MICLITVQLQRVEKIQLNSSIKVHRIRACVAEDRRDGRVLHSVDNAVDREAVLLLWRAVHTLRAGHADHSYQNTRHGDQLVARRVRRGEVPTCRIVHVARKVALKSVTGGVRVFVAAIEAVCVNVLDALPFLAVIQKTLVKRQPIDDPMVICVHLQQL